jgi:hypothetical protein
MNVRERMRSADPLHGQLPPAVQAPEWPDLTTEHKGAHIGDRFAGHSRLPLRQSLASALAAGLALLAIGLAAGLLGGNSASHSGTANRSSGSRFGPAPYGPGQLLLPGPRHWQLHFASAYRGDPQRHIRGVIPLDLWPNWAPAGHGPNVLEFNVRTRASCRVHVVFFATALATSHLASQQWQQRLREYQVLRSVPGRERSWALGFTETHLDPSQSLPTYLARGIAGLGVIPTATTRRYVQLQVTATPPSGTACADSDFQRGVLVDQLASVLGRAELLGPQAARGPDQRPAIAPRLSRVDSARARRLAAQALRTTTAGACSHRPQSGHLVDGPVLPEISHALPIVAGRGPRSGPLAVREALHRHGAIVRGSPHLVTLADNSQVLVYVQLGGPSSAVDPSHCRLARESQLSKLAQADRPLIRNAAERLIQAQPDTSPGTQQSLIMELSARPRGYGFGGAYPARPGRPIPAGLVASGTAGGGEIYLLIAHRGSTSVEISPRDRKFPARRNRPVGGLYEVRLPSHTGPVDIIERNRAGHVTYRTALRE